MNNLFFEDYMADRIYVCPNCNGTKLELDGRECQVCDLTGAVSEVTWDHYCDSTGFDGLPQIVYVD